MPGSDDDIIRMVLGQCDGIVHVLITQQGDAQHRALPGAALAVEAQAAGGQDVGQDRRT